MLYLLCICSIIYMLDVLCLLIWGSISFGFLLSRPGVPDLVKKAKKVLICIKFVVILIITLCIRF